MYCHTFNLSFYIGEKKCVNGVLFQCSSTCGSGVQERSVICVKKLDKKLFTIVGKENCRGRDKPEMERPCEQLPPCQPQWFITPWTQVQTL